ncbi:MAG: hypothetical protein AAFX93_19010 [Verrucomicrobiota bacterium]
MNPFLSPEAITAVLSLVGSAIMTMWSQRAADLAEERKYRAGQAQATEESTGQARQYEGKWKGFYWVRSAIALIVVAFYFLWPSFPALAAAFTGDPIQIVIGYYDTSDGFWPWQVSMEHINWIKTGSSAPDAVVSVFDPVRNIALIAIIGFYFGNQVARRA